ncbi:MAG: DedA family protein [Acetobacteraceae bacterium]
MLDLSVRSLIAFAAHHQALQAGAIILATFILEDAATVLAAMAAQSGQVSIPLALASLYVGIVAGDIGLYGLGWLAARFRLFRRLLPPHAIAPARSWLAGRVFRVVLVSRFLPGVRLPTYTACGFLSADLRRFAAATALATSVWTSGLFVVSLRLGAVLMAHYGAWRWAGAAGLVLFLMLAGRLARQFVRTPAVAAPRR